MSTSNKIHLLFAVQRLEEKKMRPKQSVKRSKSKRSKRSKSKRSKSNRSVKTSSHKFASRGSRTKGWHDVAPQHGTQRHQLKSKCGSACFLMPETEGFPICARCKGENQCECKIDCRGVQAAKNRAAQWGHPKVVKKANELLKSACN